MSTERTPEQRLARTKRLWEKKNLGKVWSGYKRSDMCRERIRSGRIGKSLHPLSQETIQKIHESTVGRPKSKETRRKMSIAQLGATHLSSGDRVVLSEESRTKMRIAKQGSRNPMWNIGQQHPRYSKKHTLEAKKRISCKILGISPESWTGFATEGLYCEKWDDPVLNIKKRVRAFFKGRCIECGKTKEENGGKFLDVNHVSMNKDACCTGPKFEWLFVLLCRSDHGKATVSPGSSELRYKELIALQYGGKCYYTLQEFQNLIECGVFKSSDWGRKDGH